MKIHVTSKDIKNGEQCNDCRCPIALALTRAGFVDVSVLPTLFNYRAQDGTQTGFTKPGRKLPIKVQKFIERFDKNGRGGQFKKLAPFTFELKD